MRDRKDLQSRAGGVAFLPSRLFLSRMPRQLSMPDRVHLVISVIHLFLGLLDLAREMGDLVMWRR